MISLELIPFGLLAAFALLELINLYLKGVFISSALYFFILSKIKGTTFIRTPEYLFTPIANELITPSSELVVGNEHEYDEVNISRFALDPDSTKHARGTILTVISIGRTRLELSQFKEISS